MSCLLPVAADVAATAPELAERLRAFGPESLDDTEALQLASGASPDQIQALLEEFGSRPQVRPPRRRRWAGSCGPRRRAGWRSPATLHSACCARHCGTGR